jgi:hypothetical protein
LPPIAASIDREQDGATIDRASDYVQLSSTLTPLLAGKTLTTSLTTTDNSLRQIVAII